MKYKPIVIGIAGTKSSGKDTLASMINYILRVGIAKADYYSWFNESEVKDTKHIIHFADALKDICSLVFNINRDYFDNTDYKDKYAYILNDKTFIKLDDLTDKHQLITISHLNRHRLSLPETCLSFHNKGKISCITLRTLMQHIGTEIFRTKISVNTWIDICINKAITISDKGHCIISDVRFKNEADAIRNIPDRKSIIIKIVRNTGMTDNHSSETINFRGSFKIENCSTKMALFYKTLMLLKKVIK